MKKIFTLAACMFASTTVLFAQEFVDAEGTVIPDGSTITATKVTNDGTYGKIINSGLYVKTDKNCYLNVAYTVNASSGTVQLCFPGSCQTIAGTGENGQAPVKASDTAYNLQSEWLVDGVSYGTTATVTYQLKSWTYYEEELLIMGKPTGQMIHKYKDPIEESKVTVIYKYEDPAGINGTEMSMMPVATSYYDMAGRMMKALGKGLFIKKATMADGTVKTAKVVIK